MSYKLYKILVLLGFPLLLGSLGACRSADADNTIATGGVSAVKFNVLGAEYSNVNSLAESASLDEVIAPILDNHKQVRNVLITPSTGMTVELYSSVHNTKQLAQTSSLSNTVADVSGDNLTSGVKFRVIAYRQSNGNYHTHQDYTVGETSAPMMLDNGAVYNIIVYSYGTNRLPLISSGEKSNISSAQVNYDDLNRDFMYQKVSYTPVSSNNVLNIKLNHKITRLTTVMSSSEFLGSINSISTAYVKPHYSDGVINLSNGSISNRSTATIGEPLDFQGTFPTYMTKSLPVLINADTNNGKTGGFSAMIDIAGRMREVNLLNLFKIIPSNNSTLSIKFNRCGAYLGLNNTEWKDFMCYNLGADTSADPFAPSASIQGAKYQWGASTGETGFYYSQANDQSNSGAISGWSRTFKGDNAWSNDNGKAVNDPCPTGFILPTWDQIRNLLVNNNFTRVGTWTSSSTNFGSGISIGKYLFLPAAGARDNSSGSLYDRGSAGYYWSKTISTNETSDNIKFDNTRISSTGSFRNKGFSVRCIAE